MKRFTTTKPLIPANAGIQGIPHGHGSRPMGPRFRGDERLIDSNARPVSGGAKGATSLPENACAFSTLPQGEGWRSGGVR
jgi:hypothetical protein